MNPVIRTVDAAFMGFVYSLLAVLAGFVSIVGIILGYIAEEVIKFGLRMLLDFAGRPVPAKIDDYCWFILFVVLWIAMSAYRWSETSPTKQLPATSQ